jgi:hypothetical protein
LEKIFEKYSELDEDNNDKIITPIQFKKLCREYEIYGAESQAEFLEKMSRTGLVQTVEELKEKWSDIVKPWIDKS